MQPVSLTVLRREAEANALITRRDLGIPANLPVDVYSAIRRLRLWLLFQPLDGIFGMYQKFEDAAGVVVNVKVPPSVQRYTAAHELGHHILGHPLAIDPEDHISRWTDISMQEMAAQMFASEFLMPIAAVNKAAMSLGIRPRQVDEISAYQLSLRLRTSYSATIMRLQTLKWISDQVGDTFRKTPPQVLKTQLLGRKPADARADVWFVTDREDLAQISPVVGDELVFSLEENPSTGFRWDAELATGLSIDADDFVQASSDSEIEIGGPGRRVLQVAVMTPSRSDARFSLRRPWRTSDQPETAVAFNLDATPRPSAGVDELQRAALVA